jgi:hypothetical protein
MVKIYIRIIGATLGALFALFCGHIPLSKRAGRFL